MASWTGTMFEYLMPELFLPLCRDSLLWESARFCLYVQRRDLPGGEPWGQSESAFFSLDPSLSYRYKPTAAPSWRSSEGWRRTVWSRHTRAFWLWRWSRGPRFGTLRRLCSLGFTGRFGLWEAVDYTPSRTSGRGGESVRCVMAHHLGMSLTAIANCLLDDIMCRRFMSDPAMSAHRCLLEERLPIGAVTLRRRGAEGTRKAAAHSRPQLGAGRSLPGRGFSGLLPRLQRGLPPYAHVQRSGLCLRRGHRTLPADRIRPWTAPLVCASGSRPRRAGRI